MLGALGRDAIPLPSAGAARGKNHARRLPGTIDTQQAARVSAQRIDEQTLVVASSDLSHYHPYDQAHLEDTACVKCICQLDIPGMQQQEACGKTPILVLMHLAKLKHWKAKLLDLCNSGDRTGDKQRVVGYAAIAFYEEEPWANRPGPRRKANFHPFSSSFCSAWPAPALRGRFTGESPPEAGTAITPPLGNAGPASLRSAKEDNSGLHRQHLPAGALAPGGGASGRRRRRCTIPRFAPVQAEELPKIDIEVSVLTVPQPLEFTSPQDLLESFARASTEWCSASTGTRPPSCRRFGTNCPARWNFSIILHKSRPVPDAWQSPGTEVLIYQAVAFRKKTSRASDGWRLDGGWRRVDGDGRWVA